MNPDHSKITVPQWNFFDKGLYYDILKIIEYTYNFSFKIQLNFSYIFFNCYQICFIFKYPMYKINFICLKKVNRKAFFFFHFLTINMTIAS